MSAWDFGFLLPPWGMQTVTPTSQPPQPIVEVGFTTDPTVGGGLYGHWDDPTHGGWDVGLWAPDQVWTDVTGWLRSYTFSRGSTRVEGPILRYDAGTASVVLINSDGRFNPANLSGPYVSGGITQVQPMVPVRIRAAYNGIYYDRWRGFADSWQVTYPNPGYSEVTLTATDAQKVLGNVDRVALGGPVGAGELSGVRVNRILDSVGWPAADRAAGQGRSPMAGTTLDGDAWTELLLVQDSEIGEVYIDAAGKVVFRDRHAVITQPRSVNSQATFGRPTLGELPYISVTPEYDDTTIRNEVRIARVGGTQQTAVDVPSQTRYLVHTHERTDLLILSDAESLAYAQFVLALTKDAELRFAQITVDPRADEASLYPQCFGRDFGDRITIISRPPPSGETVTRDVFIRGVAEQFTAPLAWTVTWTLQSATKYQFGRWDTGLWDAAWWAY